MIKRLTDLPLAQQQHLLENLDGFVVHVDVNNMQRFIRYQGESINYESIKSAQFLQG